MFEFVNKEEGNKHLQELCLELFLPHPAQNLIEKSTGSNQVTVTCACARVWASMVFAAKSVSLNDMMTFGDNQNALEALNLNDLAPHADRPDK